MLKWPTMLKHYNNLVKHVVSSLKVHFYIVFVFVFCLVFLSLAYLAVVLNLYAR